MGLEKLALNVGDVVNLDVFNLLVKSKLVGISKEELTFISRQYETKDGDIFKYVIDASHAERHKDVITPTYVFRTSVRFEDDDYPKLDRELKDVSL